MKKFLPKKNQYVYGVCLVLFLSYISLFQNSMDNSTNIVIEMGFPDYFYTIYVSEVGTISTHFNISSFLLDVFVLIFAYNLLLNLIEKIKKHIKLIKDKKN